MHVSRRDNRSKRAFLKRTVAAQIHLCTAIAAVVGLFWLVPVASKSGLEHTLAAIVFGITAVMVFAVSGTYHVLHDGYQISLKLAHQLETLDQCSIYLFIAGTYTPFLINAIAQPWQTILLFAVWIMAALGIVYTAFRHHLPQWAQSRAVYTSLFVIMGWTLLIRAVEIYEKLSPLQMIFFMGGIAAYSIGAGVYGTKKPKLFAGVFGFHELWHVFVTIGFVFHYAMIWCFYLR